MNRAHVFLALIGAAGAVAPLACEGEVTRTYYDDLVDATADVSVVDTGIVVDAGVDDGEAALDAPVEAETGCGPTDTTLNCGACGAACDTANSTGASCDGNTCSYTACTPGFGDCHRTAPNADGCETQLNTVQNCGGCGVTCTSAHASAVGCSGTACTYTCQTGPEGSGTNYISCSTATPNSVGCECKGTGCCAAGACQTEHDNGVGKLADGGAGNTKFYDCSDAGAYTVDLAQAACVAYTGSAAACASFPCKPVELGNIVCTVPTQTGPGSNCICWNYAGTGVGHYDVSDTATCYCPTASGDPSWH